MNILHNNSKSNSGYKMIVLNLQRTSNVESYRAYFNIFSKSDLAESMKTIHKLLKTATVQYTADSEERLVWLMKQMLANSPSKLLKEELLLLKSATVCDIHNLSEIARLDETGKWTKLWKMIAVNPDISLEYAREILGHKLPLFSAGSSWNPRFMTDAMLDPASLVGDEGRYSYYNDKPEKIFIPQSIRSIVVSNFLGENILSPVPVKEIPEGLVTENFEQFIYDDCAFLDGIRSCNALTTASGSLTAAKIKSVSSKLQNPDFDNTENIKYKLSRKAMLILAFAKCMDRVSSAVAITPKVLVRNIADSFGKYLVSTDFTVMLPKFKGFTKNLTESSRAAAISRTVDGLMLAAVDGWIDMSLFPTRYLCNDNIVNGNAAFTFLFYRPDYNRYCNIRLESQNAYERAPNLNYWKDLTFPYVVHYIKLLCAVGMIEMATDSNADLNDPMEGIRYVRLTPLGRYAYGFDKDYKYQTASKIDQFELEKDNLIVTVLDPKSPYMMFLEQFGKKVGGNRFYISASEMIRKAGSKDQVSMWVDNFKTIVCPEPEGVWKEMLEEVESRMNVRISTGSKYIVMQIDTSVPGLVEFITGDTEIRSNVIFAQKGYLLVNSSHFSDFQSKLKSAGYLL